MAELKYLGACVKFCLNVSKSTHRQMDWVGININILYKILVGIRALDWFWF